MDRILLEWVLRKLVRGAVHPRAEIALEATDAAPPVELTSFPLSARSSPDFRLVLAVPRPEPPQAEENGVLRFVRALDECFGGDLYLDAAAPETAVPRGYRVQVIAPGRPPLEWIVRLSRRGTLSDMVRAALNSSLLSERMVQLELSAEIPMAAVPRRGAVLPVSVIVLRLNDQICERSPICSVDSLAQRVLCARIVEEEWGRREDTISFQIGRVECSGADYDRIRAGFSFACLLPEKIEALCRGDRGTVLVSVIPEDGALRIQFGQNGEDCGMLPVQNIFSEVDGGAETSTANVRYG